MNPNFYLYISGAAIVCFGIYHFFLSKRSVIHRIIRKAPRKRIADVADGETVSIQGKVVCAGRHLKAPLSGRRCVYYHVKVVDSSSRRELLRNYIDLEEEKVADICIRDGESYAVIDTRLIAHYVIHDEEQHSGFWSATSLN